MTNELTVRVEHPELPAIRWNEAEVQQNLTEMLAAYTGRIYTPDTIKDAKADRAAVNKLDKQLSDAARSAKAFYMKPLEEFLQSAKQMQGQCKAVSGAIDQQVKAVEEAERQDKQDALRAVYADCIGELRELIPFDRLLVPQWLNKTYDLAKASRELRRDVETRRKELKIIQDTCGEDAEACKLGYLRVLDLNAALAEHLRLQDNREKLRRAEAERQAAIAALFLHQCYEAVKFLGNKVISFGPCLAAGLYRGSGCVQQVCAVRVALGKPPILPVQALRVFNRCHTHVMHPAGHRPGSRSRSDRCAASGCCARCRQASRSRSRTGQSPARTTPTAQP